MASTLNAVRIALLAAFVCGSLSATCPPIARAVNPHQPSILAEPTILLAPTVPAARTLDATDKAVLHYTRSAGSRLLEEGSAHGTLPGKMRASCEIGPTVSASFTIYTRKGSITGHGTATPRGSGRYESFAGSLTVTGGTGRYAHTHGRAGLYGTFDRRTYALVLQTTGRLSY